MDFLIKNKHMVNCIAKAGKNAGKNGIKNVIFFFKFSDFFGRKRPKDVSQESNSAFVSVQSIAP